MDENRKIHESNPDELHHEPVKGYPTAFGLAMALATLYLVYVFATSL